MANTLKESTSGFRTANYGEPLAAILSVAPLNELGPGEPVKSMAAKLRALSADDLFAPQRVIDAAMAKGALSGLWLRFNFLDESHSISQGLQGPTGSYWHAIMHRREPDYWNSKYWFRQVGDYPTYGSLCSAANDLAVAIKLEKDASFLTQQDRWDPYRFVDLVESAAGTGSATETLCREIQRREWELFFDYCCAKATGRE